MGQALLKAILAQAGVYPTRLTEAYRLKALIRELAPWNTGKNLIRLGRMGDGGYLIPDDLDGIEACFSPGVSNIVEFERACADRGMRVFLADNSVQNLPLDHDLFVFTRKHVGAITGDNVITLDEWVGASLPDSSTELMLQMDIEGCEYETLLSVSTPTLRRMRILVVEFHNLEKLWSKPFYCIASRAFEKVLQTHRCVHLHPNNSEGSEVRAGLEIPRVMEMTFLRHDRLTNPSPTRVFPHELDCDNDPEQPPLPLPRCWYDGSLS
ncbi:MAG: hypothetical protein C5B58_14625 [Acidobacteria bacterium]|nr:MAG: hypothetical protein C5B58_14625 [Acidobacteriota bacterium]